jgi:hypothetical protein
MHYSLITFDFSLLCLQELVAWNSTSIQKYKTCIQVLLVYFKIDFELSFLLLSIIFWEIMER